MATKKTPSKSKKTEHGAASAAPGKVTRAKFSALDGGGNGNGGIKTEHGAKGPKPVRKG